MWLQHGLQVLKRDHDIGEVMQGRANDDHVERTQLERRVEDVCCRECVLVRRHAGTLRLRERAELHLRKCQVAGNYARSLLVVPKDLWIVPAGDFEDGEVVCGTSLVADQRHRVCQHLAALGQVLVKVEVAVVRRRDDVGARRVGRNHGQLSFINWVILVPANVLLHDHDLDPILAQLVGSLDADRYG